MEPDAFTTAETAQILSAVRKKYSEVSASAKGYFKYPVGREGARVLGYDKELFEDLPDELLGSFCGVGNPFAINPIEEGSVVLDIGCGAGFDLYAASLFVGEQGKVAGVDLTREMVDRARTNIAALNVKNAEVHLVSSELLPFAGDTFDNVISNGVINLSPRKQALFTEIFRALKPGGRLQFADIILEKPLPAHLATNVESWSQ
jgi:arsenite methyltransferase